MLRDEYGRLIARSGGVGVADAVMRQLLRAQEAS
jgi:Rod binding domain-containing protein